MTPSSARPPGDLETRRQSLYRERLSKGPQELPEFHSPSVQVLISLAEAYHAVSTTVTRSLAAHDISPSALNLLGILSACEGGGCPLGELSGMMVVTPASITGLVDSLVRRGFVERVADATDRRVRIARITPAGRKLLDRVLPPHHRFVHDLTSDLSDDEMQQLSQLLDRLRGSVRQHAPPTVPAQ